MSYEKIDLIERKLEKYRLSITCRFVPFSLSRDRKEPRTTINWDCKLHRNAYSLPFEYSQGIGHHPLYKTNFNNIYEKDSLYRYIKNSCETGKYSEMHSKWRSFAYDSRALQGKPLPEPRLADLLYSLVMDSEVIYYPDFKTWAMEYGYDDDSIKAKMMYDACLATGLKFRYMFGSDEFSELKELFEDY